MIRRHATSLRLALMAVDAVLAMASFTVLAITRFGSGWGEVLTSYGLPAPVLVAGWAVMWTAIVWLLGLYRMRVRWTAQREVLDLARAGVLLGIFIFGALYALHLSQVSRLFLATLLAGQVTLTFATRFLVRRLLLARRAAGQGVHHMLIVGAGLTARAFAARVERRRELGLVVVGFVAASPGEAGGARVLGLVEDLLTILHENVVDEVAICLPEAWSYLLGPVAQICQEEGRIVRVPLTAGAPEIPGGIIEDFSGIPLLSLVYGPDRTVALAVKRIMDVLGATAVLVVLMPVFGVVALSILVRDGRPVHFRQERVGLNGRRFQMFKFRTMAPDAERRLDELRDRNEIRGHAFKVSADPRITRTGAFLRRTSLDELPQALNVLHGEMSLVGPRPPLPSEVEGYDLWHRRRLSMKPGITGFWQVSGRREEDFDRWVELDLAYIDRWSLLLDLRILLGTIPAVLRGSGR